MIEKLSPNNSIMSNLNFTPTPTKDTNDELMVPQKGTKPFLFIKKYRNFVKRNKNELITITQEVCHLLNIQEGDNFNIYCDQETNTIIAENLP